MRRLMGRLLGGSVFLLLILSAPARAHDMPKELPAAPKGFDTKRDEIKRGQLETVEYDSKTVGGKRKMVVYTPPGYSKDNKYPVFYLLHGAGDDETGWQKKGAADVILDNLYADKKTLPMIVVMPNGFAKGSDGGRNSGFEDDLLKDIIPYVEAHYPVKADADHRALAGLSMGGGQSLRIGLKHLDTFAYVGAFSAGGGGANAVPDADAAKKMRLLWVSCGDKDPGIDRSKAFDTALNEKKIPHIFHVDAGAHEWPVWKNDLYLFAPMLFQDKPADKPKDKAEDKAKDLPDAPKSFATKRNDIERGKVEAVEYDSKTVGIKRKATVYTPPGYSKDNKYPVLYLLHGLGGNEMNWQKGGSADVILDNLYADKKLVPMIVVMPNGRASADPPGGNFREQSKAYEAFEDDLIKDLIPFIEAHYSVQADREHRALAGLSMGGGQSLNFGLKNLDTFAWVGGFSSAPNTKKAADLVTDPDAATKKLRLLWVSCGDKDSFMNVSKAFHTTLEEKKVPHVWHVDTGAHEWAVWKNDLYLLSQMLFRDKQAGRVECFVMHFVALGCCALLCAADKPAAPQRLAPLVKLLTESDDAAVQRDILRGMYEALQGRRLDMPDGWAAVEHKLADSPDAEVRQKALMLSVMFGDKEALASLRKTVTDTAAKDGARRLALQTLLEVRAPDTDALLRGLLADKVLRGAALRGLAAYKDPEIPKLILEHYAAYTDAEKADAVNTLASRIEYSLVLLDAVDQNQVPRRDISAFTARQMLAFNNKGLTEKVNKVWGSLRPPAQDKAALLTRYKSLVPPDALTKADRAHGRLLFAKTCATCHTLFDDGGKIGPDLTGSQRTNPDYILSKVLDPSAAVSRDYQLTVFELKNGRSVSGLIKSEAEKTVTVQTQNEVLVINKADVDARKQSAQSMMPDGLFAQLKDVDVRDLIAYLAGAEQVPLPAGAPPKSR